MTRDVIIHDIRGRRTCTDADFPLAIGAGSQADIRLPDMETNATFAFVGRSESHIFIQPADEALPVVHNDQVLTDSRWLEHGDVLRMANSTVRYQAGATSIAFVVDVEVVAPAVEPPKGPPPAPPPSSKGSRDTAAGSASKRRRIVTGVALSVFLVLALAAGFVFLATSVSVQITPTPDRWSIDGTLPGFEIGERLLLIPGEYRVRASKAGYRPLDTRVDIAGSGNQTLEYVLDKLPGMVSFVVRPDVAASVSMDGTILGSTPITDMEISPGEHEFRVEAPRYAPASVRVEVRGLGERQSVDVVLSPLWAEVSIGSRPAGARVLLDGKDIGETPLRAEILEGTYRLALEREGFDSVSTTLGVIANRAQELPEFTLVESDGLLIVETTPPGASVTVAGQFRGRTPVELSLAPRGRHTLKISKAGYESIERQVKVDPATSEKLALTLSPRYGTVFIASLPVDAELYVDGRLHGPATGRLELTTRPHRLEVRRAGYKSFSTTVTPRAGVSQEISVTLATIAQAKAVARKPVMTTAEGQTLKLLEPARFRMGASRREQGRRANESQRLVEITRPYYLSVKEVSNGEYRRFKPAHASGAVGGRSLNGQSQPVVQVTWEDAVGYLNWLSAKDSLPLAYEKAGESFVPVQPPNSGYRLPTEAEWTYAARYAGKAKAQKYPWGNTFPPTGPAGNFADSSASTLLPNTLNDYGDGYPVSAPVGSFAPTGPGFFDLGGNVAEWTQDFYAVYPNAANVVVMDPTGPATGRHRVVRGSSWRHAGISELRLSYRDYSDKARNDLGFRIARYAE
ncbi:MAG: PEGA domain-containing protein [Gammaproteobacteria bacterium]|nr:MAG: PEGA domain-containing protein [Gammaproteobacteria bacterium]